MLGSRWPRVTLSSCDEAALKRKQQMAALITNSPSVAFGSAKARLPHVLSSGIFALIVCDGFDSSFSAFISFYAIGYTLCFTSIGTVCSEGRKVQEFGCKRSD